MRDKANIFNDIDNLIKRVDNFRNEPLFSDEKTKRQNKSVSPCPRGYITITCLHKGACWSVEFAIPPLCTMRILNPIDKLFYFKKQIAISYADRWFLRI